MLIKKFHTLRKSVAYLALSSTILRSISVSVLAMDGPQVGNPQETAYLQRMSNPTLANQEWTNKWLESLVESSEYLGYKIKAQDIPQKIPQLEFLLRLPEGKMRPDQKGVNSVLKYSVIRNNPAMMEYLLKLPEGYIRPDQGGMNEACSVVVDRQIKLEEGPPKVTREKYQSIVETFQKALKLSFNQAATQSDLVKIEYILNLQVVGKSDLARINDILSLIEKMKPVQNQIDHAFTSAANQNGNQQIVQFFLNQENRNTRPSQGAIDRAYREATGNNQLEMATLLMPHVSEDERNHHAQPQAGHPAHQPGRAFEIHNYANTMVHGTKTIMNAIFENMSSRVPSDCLLSFRLAYNIINQAIEIQIPVDKQIIAKKATFTKLASDNDYEQQLSLVVSFILLYHYGSMNTWIQGFVGESIDAYKGSKDSVSCVKGVKERIATGLRTIDKDLDQIFAKAEGPEMMKNYLKLWNPWQQPKKAAELLMAGNLTSKDNLEVAINIFCEIFDNVIIDFGLSVASYGKEKKVIIDGLEDCYDSIQRAVRELETTRKKR